MQRLAGSLIEVPKLFLVFFYVFFSDFLISKRMLNARNYGDGVIIPMFIINWSVVDITDFTTEYITNVTCKGVYARIKWVFS